MTRRRLAALTALLLTPVALVATVIYVADDPAQTFSMALSFGLFVAALWFGLVRRGVLRLAGVLIALVLAAGLVESVFDHRVVDRVAIIGLFWVALACAAAAFAIRVHLPRAARPRRPVMFVNPRSGDGKAARLGLVAEARTRGIEPVELEPGDDLAELARAAADGGADGLAMAGGDGSQAVVAAVAAERGLPFACIPAGTRNHFALDLGVDPADVIGALDAFVDGGERKVDLAEVNGRVFVNNVSLGLYATAIQDAGYRSAKLRTLLATLPQVAGPDGTPPDLQWDGRERPPVAILLVSNNRYRLGVVPGAGTRPRIDDGQLGVAVVEPRDRGWLPKRLWRQWSVPEFEVRAGAPVAAGIDGEAVMLAPPLRFRVLPSCLRVRVAGAHPGASPSAAHPDTGWQAVRMLAGIVAGRSPDAPERDPRPALWRRVVVRPKPMRTDFPKWLVGDWNRVIRDPLDLLRLAPAIGVLATLATGDHTHTGELVGCSLIVWLPRILDVQRPFDLAFQLGMNLAIWGNVFGLFDLIYGYDKAVHFLLPCGAAMLLFVALARLRIVRDLAADAGLHDRAAMVLVTLAFGLTVGGIFEMWEWFSNTVLGTRMFVSYGDSIGDLMNDGAGALIGGAFLLWWTGRGWGTWRIPGAALRGEEPMPLGPREQDRDLLMRLGDRIARMRPPRGHGAERARPYPRLPRWLVGDWGRVLRDPVDLIRLSLLARVVASSSIAAMLYLLLVRVRAVPDLSDRSDIHERTGILLTATSLGFGVGMFYEIGAWASNGLFDAEPFTFGELIAHMAISLVASAAGAALLVVWDRAGWRTRRVPGDVLHGPTRQAPAVRT